MANARAVLETELSSTPHSDNAEFNPVVTEKYYQFITMPGTSADVYMVTGIEWKNGTAVAGNCIAGISLVDAVPPVLAENTTLTQAVSLALSGTGSVQRQSNIAPILIRGASSLGIWLMFSSATAEIRHQTGLASETRHKTSTVLGTNHLGDNLGSYAALTVGVYIKLYYRKLAKFKLS